MRILNMLILLLMAMNAAVAATDAGKGRPFTVKDAIRVATLQEEEGERLNVSPDGKRFFVVDAYGDLGEGSRVFTLRVFGYGIDSPASANPKVLASTTLRTLTNQAAISRPRWTPDGRSILFLGVKGESLPKPYRFDVEKESLVDLLPGSDWDVSAFDVQGDTCVFLAKIKSPQARREGWTLTNESLQQLLLANGESGAPKGGTTLFVSRNGGPAQRVSLEGQPAFAQFITLSLSPDGRKAVVAQPPTDVPKEWWRYVAKKNLGMPGQPLMNAMQYQLIDLESSEVQPLVNAPLGQVVADNSSPQAVWVEGGRAVFVSNTMQPIASDKEDPSDRPAVLKVSIQNPAKAPELVFSYAQLLAGERIKELRPSADGSGVEIETYMSASSYDPNPEKKRTATRRVSRFESTPQGWRVAEQSAWTSVGDVVMAGNKVRVEEDANTPPRLVMEREGRKPVLLHDFNPWLSEVHLQPIRPVTWRDKENHPWSGGIALPPSSGKNGKPPLILALKFHEPRRFSPDGPYTTAFATQALAAKGFAVIELDAVDPPSYETEREGLTEMRGIESAIDFAATAYGVDADRVGLIGFSRTSYYVVHTLVNSQKRFVAATLSDGVDGGYVQYQAYTLNHFGGYLGRAFAQMQGGHPFGKGLDAWRKNAAMFNLDRVKTPLRVGMIGQSSVLQEWELYSSLKLMQKPVEAFYIPGGTHVLVKPKERYLSSQSTVEWFDFWMNGAESKNPLEPDQYRRWEVLRGLQKEQNM